MQPTLTIGNAKVYSGNNLDVLPKLPDNSVDAIVCDPPYELGFMGKSWDSSGIAYSVELWQECLRVLKPGGHLLAFGGTRTWHRLAVAIEDAGFEIRDNIAWLYGSGFPKSHNISKAIDKAAGAERTVVGQGKEGSGLGLMDKSSTIGGEFDLTVSATDDAKAWDGWGTALKPAHEPIVVARKPVEGTIANNVLQHGVGALNIDATRIGTTEAELQELNRGNKRPKGNNYQENTAFKIVCEDRTIQNAKGRWPANIILDEYTAKLLDEQTEGKITQGHWANTKVTGFGEFGGGKSEYLGVGRKAEEKGGRASRFFYVAKASKKDRNEGLDDLVAQESAGKGNGLGRLCVICGASILKPCECPDRTFVNPPRQNFHPTVKPTALMQYLIRLVTPDNGVVLDPFTGSGSTGKAAILENKHFIGIELTAEYLPIIEGRLTHAYNTMQQQQEEDLFE